MDKTQMDALRAHYDNTDLTAELEEAELDTSIVPSPMVGITVRLPAETLEKVREIALEEGCKTTALIRRWIEEAMQKREDVSVPHGHAVTETYVVVSSSRGLDHGPFHLPEIPTLLSA